MTPTLFAQIPLFFIIKSAFDSFFAAAFQAFNEDEEEGEFNIRVKTFSLKPMTPEEAIVATADRIAALLRAGADPRTPLPGAEWTVGEAAAHLALAGKLMAVGVPMTEEISRAITTPAIMPSSPPRLVRTAASVRN